MAYRNNIYGNAAYSGFFAGMLDGRAITSSTAADYVALRSAALSMAVSVDALIAFDALVSTAAGITMLNPDFVLQDAIANVVAVPGDGGQAIITAVAALTTGNVIPSNELFRSMLLFNLCRSAVSGRFTTSTTAQAVQAAAIFAAWTTAIAGLVSP